MIALMPDIVVYIPVRNSVDWCRSTPLPAGVSYVASDNASTDGSAEALRARGVTVIKQPRDLGRIGNWQFCVRHFLDSGRPWMKWLFAGDVLASDFAAVAARALQAYPQARIVVADCIHVDGEFRVRHGLPGAQARLLQPAESLELLADSGNWFHSPINQMFHRDALADGFDYGSFVWAADVCFCMNAAAKVPALYWPECFGEFHARNRAHFQALGSSLRAVIEGALLREMAAARLEAITGDRARHAELSAKIEADLLRRLGSRWLGRSRTGSLMRAGLRGARRLQLPSSPRRRGAL
jgi:hypothetical protein